jgi:hypothetical protein
MQPIYSTSNGFVTSVNGQLRSAESLRELLAALELQRQENAALIQSYWIKSFQSN